MNREYHRWYSPSLNRDMEVLVFGHAGARVLVFPTSMGRFYEWEDRGMMNALGHHIQNGWLQVYCVDSVDSESWYCWWAHPSGRAFRQQQYDSYLTNEVLPLMYAKNHTPYTITLGASFGAYHAMNFGLRHPDRVNRIIALSGLFNIRRMTGGYSDENVYFNNPVDFITGETDHSRLELIRRQDIIIATGTGDRLIDSAREMSGVLWNKGVGNALREWNGWYHDWQYWQEMTLKYISGHD